jgi:hypothetical protein
MTETKTSKSTAKDLVKPHKHIGSFTRQISEGKESSTLTIKQGQFLVDGKPQGSGIELTDWQLYCLNRAGVLDLTTDQAKRYAEVARKIEQGN